jgi:hypothetical protein
MDYLNRNKISWNRLIDSGRINATERGGWSRVITYLTPIGVCMIHQCHWVMCDGKAILDKTEFEFLHRGNLYATGVHNIVSSDRSLKTFSTRFMKRVIKLHSK